MENKKQVFSNGQDFYANIDEHTLTIVEQVLELDKNKIIDRIWKNDYTVWGAEPDEISNRLGWLQSPNVMKNAVFEIKSFVDEIRESKFNNAVLLGMGGSSLAPEVFRNTFGVGIGFLDLVVLDSTDPGAVLKIEKEVDVKNTLFIVSTKSGGTVETISFMKYFYHLVYKKLGKKDVGKHFIAITDPGSGLEKQAKELGFRKIFLNDPNIGGRYSALSYFGLVPAALIGMNILKLLEKGNRMADYSRETVLLETGKNSAAWLGAIMGGLALDKIDKLTFISSPSLKHFGIWVEQLVAESTGKLGKGILPVCCSEPGSSEIYSNDRLFIYSKLKGEDDYDQATDRLEENGHPVVRIILEDKYDLGAEMFRWEIATIVAGHILKINPFDQPDVESAKIRAREMVAEYKEKGKLPVLPVTLEDGGLKIYSSDEGNSLKKLINTFLDPLVSGEDATKIRRYLAIQAYLKPLDEVSTLLEKFRVKIQNQYGVAVTIGFGPRFLHSTGQLHKGDRGTGVFIQLLADMPDDCPIPDDPKDDASSISFGVLKTAQALGDRQALVDAGRSVMTIELGSDIEKGIEKLIDAVD
jgi:glucose-6-phosphate isomerase